MAEPKQISEPKLKLGDVLSLQENKGITDLERQLKKAHLKIQVGLLLIENNQKVLKAQSEAIKRLSRNDKNTNEDTY